MTGLRSHVRAHGPTYVGHTTQTLARRVAQHRRSPPRRMKGDAAAHQPWDANFRARVLLTCTSAHTADLMEKHYIKQLKATSERGYNDLPAAPGRCARFYAMQAARARQGGNAPQSGTYAAVPRVQGAGDAHVLGGGAYG